MVVALGWALVVAELEGLVWKNSWKVRGMVCDGVVEEFGMRVEGRSEFGRREGVPLLRVLRPLVVVSLVRHLAVVVLDVSVVIHLSRWIA